MKEKNQRIQETELPKVSIRTEFDVTAKETGVTLPNRNYKDTMFRKLFQEKEKLLQLYNAVNNTHYTEVDQLEIVTLENAIYMNMKS